MFAERDPHRSDLFIFDTDALQGDILLRDGVSHLKYQEYAVFAKDNDYASTIQSSETDNDRPFLKHIGQCVVSEDGNGDELFHQAMREDQSVDIQGNWGPKWKGSPHLLQGRVRQVICHRRTDPRSSEDLNVDGLHLTSSDFNLMGLHPATLQYVRRTTVESMFWDRHHEKLSIIMSFPSDPRAPYDFLSMTHSVPDRTTTILVRQSFDANQHTVEDLDQYDQRMQTCRSHWAHPLVIPVMLLQVQFAWTEQAVADNHSEVIAVERDVSNMAGFDAFDETARRRRAGSSAGGGPTGQYGAPPGHHHHHGNGNGTAGSGQQQATGSGQQQQVYKKSTELMKNAHDVLKRSIRLLDTLHWMDRAIKILLEAGDALDDVRQDSEPGPAPSSAAFPTPLSARGRVGTGLLKARIQEDPLTGHWHEIRQYLDGLLQLCLSLKTDRTILEMRCKALVDIIYSKMAQEDNNLNARMAVASSRDSSSMKALAVITAVFLPGEFMSSLFGMSIFDWQPGSGGGGEDSVVSWRIWIYWGITIPLTIGILVSWRAWWVGQDRYFRKHLSKDLSEERYWTDDRKPRKLETSFLHDFIYMSVRRGESPAEGGTALFPSSRKGSSSSSEDDGIRWLHRRGKTLSGKTLSSTTGGLTSPSPAFRLRQIAFEGDEKGQKASTGIV
ncbi:hypothetical protein diail_11653 [Diaporthe ilicicola]|nr:hypothetical protein diail_11653 [Diaporthe ilicicola]